MRSTFVFTNGGDLRRSLPSTSRSLSVRPHSPTFNVIVLMHLTQLPHCDIVDLFAFLIILSTAKRQGRNRHPGISSILDAILREATLYFVFIFTSHFLFELFLFFAPVGDARYV